VNRFKSFAQFGSSAIHHDFSISSFLHNLPTNFNYAADATIVPTVITQATSYDRVIDTFKVDPNVFESDAASDALRAIDRDDSFSAAPTLIVAPGPDNTREKLMGKTPQELDIDVFMKEPPVGDNVLTFFRADQLHAGPQINRHSSALSLDIVNFVVPGRHEPIIMPQLPRRYQEYFDKLEADKSALLADYATTRNSMWDPSTEDMESNINNYCQYKHAFIFGELFGKHKFITRSEDFKKFVQDHDGAATSLMHDLDVYSHLTRIVEASNIPTQWW
jgi:hypothetical protein